jgi:hypothetical protein
VVKAYQIASLSRAAAEVRAPIYAVTPAAPVVKAGHARVARAKMLPAMAVQKVAVVARKLPADRAGCAVPGHTDRKVMESPANCGLVVSEASRAAPETAPAAAAEAEATMAAAVAAAAVILMEVAVAAAADPRSSNRVRRVFDGTGAGKTTSVMVTSRSSGRNKAERLRRQLAMIPQSITPYTAQYIRWRAASSSRKARL